MVAVVIHGGPGRRKPAVKAQTTGDGSATAGCRGLCSRREFRLTVHLSQCNFLIGGEVARRGFRGSPLGVRRR